MTGFLRRRHWNISAPGAGAIASAHAQNFAGLDAVVLHLGDERLDAVKLLLAADEAVEGDLDLLAVEIAVEVEDEDLEQRRAIVEGRAPAEIGGARATTPSTSIVTA